MLRIELEFYREESNFYFKNERYGSTKKNANDMMIEHQDYELINCCIFPLGRCWLESDLRNQTHRNRDKR